MSKKITFTLSEDVVDKIPSNVMIDDSVINTAINRFLHDEYQNNTYDAEPVLQTKMQMLQDEKTKIEQEKRALEIDFACLKQQKDQLESRIDDLAQLYPSASVLLGKKPSEKLKRKSFFKSKILKK